MYIYCQPIVQQYTATTERMAHIIVMVLVLNAVELSAIANIKRIEEKYIDSALYHHQNHDEYNMRETLQNRVKVLNSRTKHCRKYVENTPTDKFSPCGHIIHNTHGDMAVYTIGHDTLTRRLVKYSLSYGNATCTQLNKKGISLQNVQVD